MTKFEQMFLDTMKFYEDRKIPVFLHGSTLLRIIRNGTVEPRPDVVNDNEINIGILAEDFTNSLYADLKVEHKYFRAVTGKLDTPLIFYGQYPYKRDEKDHWHIKPGFVLLAKYFEGKTKRIQYMGENYCLQFPKKLFGDKKKWSKVSILGREFNAPANPKKYLTYYFGPDWKTEKKGWHWAEAEAHTTFEELMEEGEIQ